MKYAVSIAGTDWEIQKEAVQLLGRVFTEYWEKVAERDQAFPFEELSFIARAENGSLCGHLGIMPFPVSDGNGGFLRFAGVASVAVDPDFRGMGIASALCERAARWAEENHFDALPLFTGKYGVYEHHGWMRYAVNTPRQVRLVPPLSSAGNRVPARQLDERQKERIIRFYEKSPSFSGKVLRSNDRAFHSWRRIFQEPEFEFLIADEGYALLQGESVTELCTLPGAETVPLALLGARPFTLALPAVHPVWPVLQRSAQMTETGANDVYHGEGVMLRPLSKIIPQGVYFACGDKF